MHSVPLLSFAPKQRVPHNFPIYPILPSWQILPCRGFCRDGCLRLFCFYDWKCPYHQTKCHRFQWHYSLDSLLFGSIQSRFQSYIKQHVNIMFRRFIAIHLTAPTIHDFQFSRNTVFIQWTTCSYLLLFLVTPNLLLSCTECTYVHNTHSYLDFCSNTTVRIPLILSQTSTGANIYIT